MRPEAIHWPKAGPNHALSKFVNIKRVISLLSFPPLPPVDSLGYPSLLRGRGVFFRLLREVGDLRGWLGVRLQEGYVFLSPIEVSLPAIEAGSPAVNHFGDTHDVIVLCEA